MRSRSPYVAVGAVLTALAALVAGIVGPSSLLAGAGAQDVESTTTAPAAASTTVAGDTATTRGSSSGAQQQAKARPGDIVVTQFQQGTASVISTGEQLATIVEGLTTPTGIAGLEDGTILFAEFPGNRISAVGGAYGTTVTPVVADISGPYALGTSVDGAVYVTQFNDGKVAQVDLRTGKIDPIGDGLQKPIAVTGYKNEVYVAEAATGKILKYTTDRKQVEVATDLGTPNGLAITADGTIYVSDYSGNRIIRIAPNGDKSDWKQVDGPRQLALDPAFPKAGEDYQVVAGTNAGIVQYDPQGKEVSSVNFEQSVGGVGVVPGGPPPNATPTVPQGTQPTLRPTTTVASSGLIAPPEESSSNAVPILIGLLIAIVVIGGIAFFGYRWTQNREKRTEEEAGFTDLKEMAVTMTQAMGPCAAQEVELAEAEDTLHQVVGQRLGAEARLTDAEHRADTARERAASSRARAESLRIERRKASGVEEDAPPPPLSLAELGLTTEAGRAALQAFGRGELDAVKLRERWDELGESSAVAAVQGHSEKIARTTPWPEEREASLAAEQAQREQEMADDDALDARADIERMREREAQLEARIIDARVAVDDCHKRQKVADEGAAAAAAAALADIQVSSDRAGQADADKGKGKGSGGDEPEGGDEAAEPDEGSNDDAGAADDAAPDVVPADSSTSASVPRSTRPTAGPRPGTSSVEDDEGHDAAREDEDDDDSTGKIARPLDPPPPPPPPPPPGPPRGREPGIDRVPTPPPTLHELIELTRAAHKGGADAHDTPLPTPALTAATAAPDDEHDHEHDDEQVDEDEEPTIDLTLEEPGDEADDAPPGLFDGSGHPREREDAAVTIGRPRRRRPWRR